MQMHYVPRTALQQGICLGWRDSRGHWINRGCMHVPNRTAAGRRHAPADAEVRDFGALQRRFGHKGTTRTLPNHVLLFVGSSTHARHAPERARVPPWRDVNRISASWLDLMEPHIKVHTAQTPQTPHNVGWGAQNLLEGPPGTDQLDDARHEVPACLL